MAGRVTASILLLLAIACARPEARDDVVTRRLETEPASLDPQMAYTTDERLVAQCLFTPLLYLDDQLRPIPGLAVLRSTTGLEFVFELRPATFSDGTPVRPRDVLFTIRRVADPGTRSPLHSEFSDIDLKASRVLDDRQVLLAFSQARPERLTQFASLYVIPEHVYGRSPDAFARRVIGSGPYELVARRPGYIELRRRESYWREQPAIRRLAFRTISDTATAWKAVQAGEVDETHIATDVWLRAKKQRPSVVLRDYFTLNYNMIAYNTSDPLLGDPEVRRALAKCIDVDGIIRDIYGGTARPLTGPFIPGTWAYDTRVPQVGFDVEAARGTLSRRFGGKRISLEFLLMSGNSASQRLAQVLQEAYARAGVDLTIAQLDPTTAIRRMVDGQFQIGYLSVDLDADPDVDSFFHSSRMPPAGKNLARYSNATVDRLLENARRELDPRRRQTLFHEIHARVAADQPYSWLFQVSVKHAFSPRLANVRLSDGYGPFLWYPGELGWSVADESAQVALR